MLQITRFEDIPRDMKAYVLQWIVAGSDYKAVTLISKDLREVITKIHPNGDVKLCSNLWTLVNLYPHVKWNWRGIYIHRETTIVRLSESWLQPTKPEVGWLRENPNITPQKFPKVFPNGEPRGRFSSNSNNKDFATWERVIANPTSNWDWETLFRRKNFITWERFLIIINVTYLYCLPWETILLRDDLYEGLRKTGLSKELKDVICEEGEDGYLNLWHTQDEFIKRFGFEYNEDWEDIICLYSCNHRVATWEFVSQNKMWWDYWNWAILSGREDFVTPERISIDISRFNPTRESGGLISQIPADKWDLIALIENPSYINSWDQVIDLIEDHGRTHPLEIIFGRLTHNRAIATWDNIFSHPEYQKYWHWGILSLREDLNWKIIKDNPDVFDLWDWGNMAFNDFGKA